jgi:hypothetical protein
MSFGYICTVVVWLGECVDGREGRVGGWGWCKLLLLKGKTCGGSVWPQ